MSKKIVIGLSTFLLLILLGTGIVLLTGNKEEKPITNGPSSSPSSQSGVKREAQKVVSVDTLQDQYDAIVVGTDPEGIAAAVSSARNGLKTLLVEPRERSLLGGLMTEGWLNSIDMNWDRTSSTLTGKAQDYFNKGIFSEWYKKTEGHSFDVITAANAFNSLVGAEANIDLYMKASAVEPITETEKQTKRVTGIMVTLEDGSRRQILSPAVIDATQDADVAAAAGAAFTIGREDLGDPQSRMAVTAVFRLKNMDDKAWKLIAKRLNGDGDSNTGVDQMSAWGYGNEMKDYEPLNKERAKMRGLNIGRQLDGTILINALQIFGVDGLSEASRQEGMQIAREEIPHVVEYLRQFEEFKHAEWDAIAPELYVRETRHLVGLYRLSVVDLLENADQWDRIAFGSYPADIQRTSPSDNGAVVVHPVKYAVPFRSIVPADVEGLLVTGRSASYDTLAHGSARVIPTGMAAAQAAGAAVKIARDYGLSFSEMVQSKERIAELQSLLQKQGMELAPYEVEKQPYMKHPAYPGLKAAVYTGIAIGSYGNEAFKLDNPSNAQRMVNQMLHIKRMYKTHFPGNPALAIKGLQEAAKLPLTLQQACLTIASSLDLEGVTEATAQQALQNKDILTKDTLGMIKNHEKLSDGEVYLLIKDTLQAVVGLTL